MNHTAALYNPGAQRASHALPEVLEARTALRITAQLGQAADGLPHDLSERLRVARERALETAQRSRHLHASARQRQTLAHRLGRVEGPSLWLRLASALPLVMLLGGLVLIQQYRVDEQIVVAADIDSALLADDLPPAAYGDPGFTEYLRAQRTP